MNDKETVKVVMDDFIKSCAYLGHTDGIEMETLTMIFRRIYKKPEDVKDISTLLNF
jgi:hypothetical protein